MNEEEICVQTILCYQILTCPIYRNQTIWEKDISTAMVSNTYSIYLKN